MNFLNKRRLPFFLLPLAFLAGCGEKPVEQAKQAAEDVADDVRALADEPELMGTWESNCTESTVTEWQVSPLHQITYYYFMGNSFRQAEVLFTDEQCQNRFARIDYSGEFELKGDLLGDDNGNLQQIDLSYKNRLIEPLSEPAAQFFSATNLCGVDKWAINQTQNVSAEKGGVQCPFRKIPSQRFDVFQINDQDQLAFGSTEKQDDTFLSKPESRPSKISDSRTFQESDKDIFEGKEQYDQEDQQQSQQQNGGQGSIVPPAQNGNGSVAPKQEGKERTGWHRRAPQSTEDEDQNALDKFSPNNDLYQALDPEGHRTGKRVAPAARYRRHALPENRGHFEELRK